MARTLVVLAAAVLTLAMAVLAPATGASHALAQPGAGIDAFLAAAILQPGDVPAGLSIQQQGPVDRSQLASLLGQDVAAAATTGLIGAYEQTLLAPDFAGALFGKPALGADVVLAFSSQDAAAAAQAYLAQNGLAVLETLLSRGDGAATMSGATVLAPPAIGDEAQEIELTGAVAMRGLNFPVTVDVVLARRGAVLFEAAVAGLRSQSPVAEAMAQANDANIQANIGLLASG